MQKAKKAYKTPKLTTHGNAQKLTQSHGKAGHRKGPPSGILGGKGKGHGDD